MAERYMTDPVTRARDRDSERLFIGACVALFATSAAIVIVWSTSMSAIGAVAMPGGWTMSMAWMRMPRQTWAGAAAAFIGM